MAKITMVASDLTSPAVVAGEDVTGFRIRGAFDATETQVESLRKTLRKLGLSAELVQVVSADTVRPAGSQGSDRTEVREWARENGFTVSDKGRISDKILSAFDAAQRGETETVTDEDDEDHEPTEAELALLDI